jgi:hypothetical protein
MESFADQRIVRGAPATIRWQGVDQDGESADPGTVTVGVTRADGSVLGRQSTGWFGSLKTIKVMPGDTVIVPAKVDRESTYNFIVRGLRDWTQIFSNLGIGAAAIKTLRN